MTEYTKAVYDALYKFPNPDRSEGAKYVGYTREAFEAIGFRVFQRRAAWLTNRYDLTGDERILLVGAGFGFLAERLPNPGNVTSLEPSPYIQENKAAHALVPLLPHRVEDAAEAGAILPGSFDLVVTEDAVSALRLPEVPTFIEACEEALRPGLLQDRIVHFVTPLRDWPLDSGLTWLRMDEWRAFAPAHAWVDTAEVREGTS